jgi:hypothetical protein
MSEATQQLQAKFDALEDRILLRIRTPKNQLLEAWITRRFLKEVLIKSLGFWASQIFSIKASFRRRMLIRQEKRTQRLGIWLSPLRAGL